MDGRRRDLLLAAGLGAAMGGAALLAQALVPRQRLADAPGRVPLAQLVPTRFGGWYEARDIRLVAPTPDVQQLLEQAFDDTLARAYRNAEGQLVMLSLSYGRDQHGEGNMHRPETCYASQGFGVEHRRGDELGGVGRHRIAATRLMTVGPRPEPVTYWLVVGDHAVRFGLERRLAALAHGLRGEVPDGMLVRLSSVEADSERGFALHDRFARELAAALPEADARRLFGRALP
jgi:EpsI family protein